MPTYSYDVSLSTDKDWVRFLVRDVDTTQYMLSDEEIQAILDKQTCTSIGRRYYAAAECLATLHVQWMSSGRGHASKKVSQLQLVFGTGSGINIDLAIQARISELRKEGARLESPRPYAFRLL